MSIATITLSGNGQVVIPKEIRDQLQWVSGTKITMFSSANGITLKAVPTKKGRKLEDLIGMLQHEGLPLSTNALCAPVDYAQDWSTSESRCK
ncbi:MAG: AbrB/MazE/SpoVT family DNA-binding domain-containing protein [Rhodoferax sp.]|jgi:AbrB family looped-hinge helix DNA binding protein|nr:AbrB/MazE/SpoVT family DNA-binding domain-containing protein [Rhodoferax sp.]